jgi:hypothetical protein
VLAAEPRTLSLLRLLSGHLYSLPNKHDDSWPWWRSVTGLLLRSRLHVRLVLFHDTASSLLVVLSMCQWRIGSGPNGNVLCSFLFFLRVLKVSRLVPGGPCSQCQANSFKDIVSPLPCTLCPAFSSSPPGAAAVSSCLCVRALSCSLHSIGCAFRTRVSLGRPEDRVSCALQADGMALSTECVSRAQVVRLFLVAFLIAFTRREHITCWRYHQASLHLCTTAIVGANVLFSLTCCTCVCQDPSFTGPNGGPCLPCPLQTYKLQPGSQACTLCPSGGTAPSVRSGTLKFASASGTGNKTLQMPNSLSDLLAFKGARFVNHSACTTIYIGPLNDLHRYQCAMYEPLSTATTLACFTPANAQGVNLHFTVASSGFSATGNDTISYPAAPTILSIRGCPFDVGAATSGCPTQG